MQNYNQPLLNMNIKSIKQALAYYFELHPDVEYIGPAEANEFLEKQGVLNDSDARKGAPLRKLLRDGWIPNASKIGANWRIYRSDNKLIKQKPLTESEVQIICRDTPKSVHTENLDIIAKCFEPIVDDESRFLILGTMPGPQSLKSGEYYASSNNSFWKIISALYNDNKPFASYEEKIECLHKNHIALWDVYKSCEREGALDKDIKNAVPNDIEGFLEEHPSIETIIVNGQKATQNLDLNRHLMCAGSTSNANAKTLECKIEEWRLLLMA